MLFSYESFLAVTHDIYGVHCTAVYLYCCSSAVDILVGLLITADLRGINTGNAGAARIRRVGGVLVTSAEQHRQVVCVYSIKLLVLITLISRGA